MIHSKTIGKYKDAVQNNVGKKVNLTLKKGRKYITVNDCIIKNAYEAIFIVEICGESLINTKNISVCYADLLTGNARLTLVSDSRGA